MKFNKVIEKLRDGKAYKFGHKYLNGFFYKAPFPEDPEQTEIDGSSSAITYWKFDDKNQVNILASPILMLYDFDDDCEWYCKQAFRHPSKE